MESSAHQELTYDPLPNASTHIRLLSFSEDASDDSVNVRLETFELSDKPSYTALSYTWGLDNEPAHIVVNGHRLLVRPNCLFALKQLQTHRPSAWYWIDALCIDQGNDLEKGPQIQLMATIYGAAERVAVCCGLLSERTSFILADLQALGHEADLFYDQSEEWKVTEHSADTSRLEQLPGPENPDDHIFAKDKLTNMVCEAIWELSSSQYWQRLWIVQELAFANGRMLMTRHGTLSLDMFKGMSKAVLGHVGLGRAFDATRPLDAVRGLTTALFGLTGLYKDINWPDNMQAAGGPVWKTSLDVGSMDLSSAVSSFGQRGCSDRRDHIFGLLNLVNWDAHRLVIRADYTISTLDLARLVYRSWPLHQAPQVYAMTKLSCKVLYLDFMIGEGSEMCALRAEQYASALSDCDHARDATVKLLRANAAGSRIGGADPDQLRYHVIAAHKFERCSGPVTLNKQCFARVEWDVQGALTPSEQVLATQQPKPSPSPWMARMITYAEVEPGDILLETDWGNWTLSNGSMIKADNSAANIMRKGPWIIVRCVGDQIAIVGYVLNALRTDKGLYKSLHSAAHLDQEAQFATMGSWHVSTVKDLQGASFGLQEDDMLVLAMLSNAAEYRRKPRAQHSLLTRPMRMMEPVGAMFRLIESLKTTPG